jgi:hypothetical protein
MNISIDPAVAVATGIMAFGLIWVGVKQMGSLRQQVKRLEESTKQSEKSSRAMLIIKLNEIYSGIIEARRDASDLIQWCKRKQPTDTGRFQRALATGINRLRISSNPDFTSRYYRLRSVIDFGELVGFLVLERQLLDIDDVKGMWGTAIKDTATCFEKHITRDLQPIYPDAYVFLLRLKSLL